MFERFTDRARLAVVERRLRDAAAEG